MIGGITDWILGLHGWVALAGISGGDGAVRLDRPVFEWFVRHREPWLTTVMRIVTVLGSSAFLIPLVIAVGAWCWRRQHSSRGFVLLAGAYGGAFLLSRAVKRLTNRARPPAALAVGHFSGSAFPSGHATQAAAVYGMLALVLAPTTSRRRRKVAICTGAVLIVVLVGISRLYLGAHWFTDVAGGLALGGLWTVLARGASAVVTGRGGTPHDGGGGVTPR